MRLQASGLSRFHLCSELLTIAVLFSSAFAAFAADLYWNAPTGGTGAWDTVNTTWSTTATGPNDTIWNNANGDNAIMLGATGGNIAVESTGITVGNLTLEIAAAPAYDFTAGGGPITFVGATPTLMLPTIGMTTNIRVPLAGTAGLIINSPGTVDSTANLWLEAASTLSGVKTIKSSVQVTLGNDAAFGAYAGGAADQVIVEEGAQVVSWVNRIVNNNITLNGSGSRTASTGGVMRQGGNQTLTLNGAITLGSNVQLKADGGSRFQINNTIDGSAANANLTMVLDGSTASIITGNISLGAGSLIKTGAQLNLYGNANNWTGGTTINTGNLQLGDGGATGSLPDSGTISIGGTLLFNSTNTFTFTTASIMGSGGITLVGAGTSASHCKFTFT